MAWRFGEVAQRITNNVLGIVESGEIEAKSFDFAPRRTITNYYDINLKKKTNKTTKCSGIQLKMNRQ